MFAREIVNYIDDLKHAGVPDEQARIHAEKLAEMMQNNLVSKYDLNQSEQKLENKIDFVEQRLESKIDLVEQRLNTKIDKLDSKIESVNVKLDWMLRLGGIIALFFGILNFFHLYFPSGHL